MKMKRVNEMKRKIIQYTVPWCESEDKNRDRFFVKFFYQWLVSVAWNWKKESTKNCIRRAHLSFSSIGHEVR